VKEILFRLKKQVEKDGFVVSLTPWRPFSSSYVRPTRRDRDFFLAEWQGIRAGHCRPSHGGQQMWMDIADVAVTMKAQAQANWQQRLAIARSTAGQLDRAFGGNICSRRRCGWWLPLGPPLVVVVACGGSVALSAKARQIG
jgi:hypothetical protein